MAKARTATDIRTLQELVDQSGRFERLIGDPRLGRGAGGRPARGQGAGSAARGADHWWLLTSLILFVALGVLVPTMFLPHGRIFEQALEHAKQRGQVTPELRTALRDPAVRNARATDLVVVAVILTLMVTKPF